MNILDNSHYLAKAKNSNNDYYRIFKYIYDKLNQKLTKTDFDNLFDNDLQLNKQNFIFEKYLQFAVETTVNYYFSNFSEFKYEKKSDENNKNVDCSFKFESFTFNIEVKCPAIVKNNTSEIRLETTQYNIYSKMTSDTPIPGVKLPNEDGGMVLKALTLYDYLKETHEKIGSITDEKTINVLFLSLYSISDFTKFKNYLLDPYSNGLFTPNSFKPKEDYENVDIVVLTNSVNLHQNWEITDYNVWDINNCFNYIIVNSLKKTKTEGIKLFSDFIKNYNEIDSFFFYTKLVEHITNYLKDNKIESSPENIKNHLIQYKTNNELHNKIDNDYDFIIYRDHLLLNEMVFLIESSETEIYFLIPILSDITEHNL